MGFECVSSVFEQKKREDHASLCYSVAPPIIQSCSTTFSLVDLLALDDIHFSFIKNT